MKVKISYNLNLEDVPEHISDLIGNVSQKLYELSVDANTFSEEIRTQLLETPTIMGSLIGIRARLEKIDTLLDGYGSILAGFEQARLSPESILPQDKEEEEHIEEEQE